MKTVAVKRDDGSYYVPHEYKKGTNKQSLLMAWSRNRSDQEPKIIPLSDMDDYGNVK